MTKKRPRWKSDRSAAENARLLLPQLAQSFFQSGRKITKAGVTEKVLHEFRLDVKRFRYYLELFRPCYGPGLKQRIERLRQMQDYLGALNDCEVTKTMLQDSQLQRQPDKKLLLEFLDKQATRQKEAFIRYWQEKCDAPGQVKWWTDYLKRFAGAPRGPRGTSGLKAPTSKRDRKASSRRGSATKDRQKTVRSAPPGSANDTSGKAT